MASESKGNRCIEVGLRAVVSLWQGGVLRAGGITEVNAAVQAKRWKRNIQAPVVQALRGSLVVHEQGIIITSGSRVTAGPSGATSIQRRGSGGGLMS